MTTPMAISYSLASSDGRFENPATCSLPFLNRQEKHNATAMNRYEMNAQDVHVVIDITGQRMRCLDCLASYSSRRRRGFAIRSVRIFSAQMVAIFFSFGRKRRNQLRGIYYFSMCVCVCVKPNSCRMSFVALAQLPLLPSLSFSRTAAAVRSTISGPHGPLRLVRFSSWSTSYSYNT